MEAIESPEEATSIQPTAEQRRPPARVADELQRHRQLRSLWKHPPTWRQVSMRKARSVSQLAFLLRGYRVAAGLSQNRLAKSAGVDPAYVFRLERGDPKWQHPSRAVVVRLAHVMNLDDYGTNRLLVSAGHWPWSLSAEDTRLLLEIGGKISQAATASREAVG